LTNTIGIIGSGGIGGVVAQLAAAAGFKVVVSNSRGPHTLQSQVAGLGPGARAAIPEQAAADSDLVVVATPLGAFDKLPVEALAGKTVIDMMNYYPIREGQIAVLDRGEMTSSELVQRHLPGSKVVKALHNQDAPHLLINARPNEAAGRTTLPVAGDDAAAKSTVISFLGRIGYDAIDAGSLAESWRVEPGSPIYVWPYAPRVPPGVSGEEAEVFYVTTPGPRVSAAEAQQLIAKAVRPKRIGGYPEDLPPVWVAVVGRWAEVLQKARSRNAEPGAAAHGVGM
jgi:predicted dinucleotide-binding enzyme